MLPLLQRSFHSLSKLFYSETLKMVLIIRTDIKMSKGKATAQCCHACLEAYKKTLQKSPQLLQLWERHGQAKTTLKCSNEEEMLILQAKAMSLGIIAESICDAGRTQLEPGTRTVLAIGPDRASLIDQVSGHLKLY